MGCEITRDYIAGILHYDPESGFLISKESRKNCVSGEIAGHKRKDGYIAVKIQKRFFQAHRIAWLLTYGVWPSGQIDHINGIRDDNRIENLREVSPGGNQQNKRKRKNATSMLQGVCFNQRQKKWRSHITVNYKQVFLGSYESEHDAHEAYIKAKEKYHSLYNPSYEFNLK